MAQERLLQVYVVRIPAICGLLAGIIVAASLFSRTFEFMHHTSALLVPLLLLYALIGGISLVAFRGVNISVYKVLLFLLPIVVTAIVGTVNGAWYWMLEQSEAAVSKTQHGLYGGEAPIYEAQSFVKLTWYSLSTVFPVFVLLLLYSLIVIYRLDRASRLALDEGEHSA